MSEARYRRDEGVLRVSVDSADTGAVDPAALSDDIYVIASEPQGPLARSAGPPARREVLPARASHIRLDIQGLRAIAVGAVIVYHAGPFLPGGFVGVDIFFVISGYVIAGVLRRSADSSPTPLRDFYGRRVRRLMPPAALMVATTLVVGLFIIPFGLHSAAAKSALAATMLSSNVWFTLSGNNYFSTGTVHNPFLHTWSLGVEEQFYLIVPLLFVLLHRADRRWSRSKPTILPLALGAIGLISFIACLLTTRSGRVMVGPYAIRYTNIAFYSSPTRAWEFLAGFLICGVVLPARPGLAVVLRAVAAVALAWCFVLYSDAMAFPGWRAIVPVGATLGLLIAGTADNGRSRVLSSRPLVVIGDLSYGLYLWHWPALVLCRFAFDHSPVAVPLGLVSTVGLATISHKVLELPLRGAPSAVAMWRSVRTAVLCSALPVLLAAALIVASPVLRTARGIAVPQRFDYSGAQRSECVEDGPHREWNRKQCTWNVDGRPSVFLVGDSHAWAISALVLEAAQRSGLGFETWTHFGCPFSTAVAIDAPGCAAWQASVLQAILAERPAIVVIANRSPTYTRAPGEVFDVKLPGLPLARNEDEALVVWDRGLRPAVSQLADAGLPMLLFSTVPEFRENPLERVSFLHPDGDMDPLSLADVAVRRGRAEAVEQAIGASTHGLKIFDPVPYLCDPLCRQFDGATWRYYDDDHLTPAGAERLRDPLEVAMRGLAVP